MLGPGSLLGAPRPALAARWIHAKRQPLVLVAKRYLKRRHFPPDAEISRCKPRQSQAARLFAGLGIAMGDAGQTQWGNSLLFSGPEQMLSSHLLLGCPGCPQIRADPGGFGRRATQLFKATGVRCGGGEGKMEAGVGIEPAYAALQAAA